MALVARLLVFLHPQNAAAYENANTLAEARFLFRGALLLFVATNCIAPFTAIQTGLQRMGVTNVLGFGASLVRIGGTVFFLEGGHGVRGLMYANAVVLGAFGVASVGTAFVLCRGLRVSPARASKEAFSKLFRFGWRTQVSRLSNLVMFETDVLVIGLLLRDLELTGLYKIGVELANKMRQVPLILLTALIPAASELDALDEREKLRRLYVVASKYVSLVTLPMVALFAGAAGVLMKTWMGSVEGLLDSANVLRLIAFGYIANIVAGAGITVALGMGRPGLQMISGLISMTSNIVLTVVLVLTMGFWGIPIATLLSMYLSWAWFLGAIGEAVEVRPMRLLKEALLWPVCVSIPPAAFCFLIDYLARDLSGRVANGAAALLAVTVTLSTVLFLIRRAPFLDGFDLRFFGETLGLNRVPGFRTWTRPISGE